MSFAKSDIDIDNTSIDKISIQLGDIIEIVAPGDLGLDHHTFYVKFLDKSKIVLVEGSGSEQSLTLDETGKLDNESISTINILSRATSASYALQNDLVPGKWIDIYFGGDVPTIITGEITNLEEDMIEITTYPEKDVIFLDFAYKGIPEDIPIIKINLRKTPIGASEAANASEAGPNANEMGPNANEMANANESGPARATAQVTSFDLEDFAEPDEEETTEKRPPQNKIDSQIREMFISADQIQFGTEVEELTQIVDLPESEQRYSLEKQTGDLLDELLSTIPNIKRTDTVLNNIHTMIERFKQLRRKYSVFDKDGNLVKARVQGEDYKPLISTLQTLQQKLYWLLPVVKNIKKVYDYADAGGYAQDYTDIMALEIEEVLKSEADIIAQYNAGNVPEQDNKYAYLLKAFNPYLTPFVNDLQRATDDAENHLAIIKVNANMAAVVDNLGDFFSSVLANNIRRRRFVMQEYNLGISGLEIKKFRGGETSITRKNITENDTIVLKSLLFLPEVTVRFARINLPYTSILLKANLNEHFLNYWQLLQNKTKVKTNMLEQLEEPVDYNKTGFLKNITEMVLENTAREDIPDNKLYEKYLNAVVPNTEFLFNLIKPHIDENLSVHDILGYLEPFMIYQEDLTFRQYQEMTEYIRKQIGDVKKNYLLKAREYNALKTTLNTFKPKVASIFDTQQALKETVLSAYGFTESNLVNMTSEEFIKTVTDIDCGRLYNTAIALVSSNLMIGNGLKELNEVSKYIKNTESAADAVGPSADVSSNKCKTYTEITKRYIALDELQEDNDTEIYFDKKYDKTHYDLLREYTKPDPAMSQEAYIGFLINNLMNKIGLKEPVARREAEAMLIGKRRVEDGDYALLELPGGANEGVNEEDITVQYYKRENNRWVQDEAISPDVFEDNVKMICNLDEKCLEVKGKCDAIEVGGNILKDANLKLVLKEFDEQLNVNKAVVLKNINDDLQDATKRLQIILDLMHTQTYKYNYKYYNLGVTLEEADEVRSPYLKLRDIILGQADYVKRQQDMVKFVLLFTREPLESEEQYWLYCIKTNTKLLPTFLARLARAFISQTDFVYTIEQICKEQGKLSDDGDSWVDKYSGYIIRKIFFSVDEEYTEEGYKNLSRAVLEADLGESIMQQNKAQRKFIDPESEKIANIVSTLTKFMGINVDAYLEFILRNVKKLQETKMPTEQLYNKMLEKAAAQGKKNQDDYQTTYYQFLIFSTLAYFFVAIQASMPPIMTRKTHPGCIKSFSGFPLGGVEDLTGLTYLACIVNKIKSPIEHWKAVQKMNISTITKRIEAQINKFLLPTEEVQELIKGKQNYLLLNPEEVIPLEHQIANMRHFLPPLGPLKMMTIQNVSEGFNKTLIDALRKGSLKQNEMINVLRGKMIQYGIGIIELIQKTVHKKTAIMTNNAGVPFLENACCQGTGKQGTGTQGTLAYFIEAQPDIALYNNQVVQLANTLHDILRMGKAGIYFDPRDTKNVIPPLPSEFSEETIYKAFIVFCKYGSNLPISAELKAVCMNKPENFNDQNSLLEQIRKLKSEGRNYSQETFQKLLLLVNRNNIVNTQKQSVQLNSKLALEDLLSSLEHRQVENVPVAFMEKLQKVLLTYEINGLTEDTLEMRTLQNYLATVNELMLTNILEFVKKTGAIGESDFKFFKDCLENISEFQETGDNMVLDRQDETVFKMLNFIKNSLRCLTREFPNIILNKVENANVVIPKHWGLSQRHANDIRELINKHYVSLYEFYDDPDIQTILFKYMQMTKDFEILAKLTEYYAPLKIGEDKYIYSTMERRLVVRLFKFYFYSTLMDLVGLKNDDEVLLRQQPKQTSLGAGEEEEDLGASALTSSEQAFASQNGDLTELEIIQGEKKDIAEKIAKLLNAFIGIICNDKKVVNYNYQSMMDKVLRSREKEKDDITSKLKNMTDEEREVETIFKNQQLERWNKGLQKGLVSYQKDTYDEERETMEKQMVMDARLNKNKDVSDMNRDMYRFDMLTEDMDAAAEEDEAMRIDYLGEDADYDELGLDGDEEFD